MFRSEDGQPLHPDRFTRRFKRLVAESRLPEVRGPHNLRHTWATLALQSGVHPKVVSERLGHATVAITLDTYSHVVEGMDAEAASAVAGQIFTDTRRDAKLVSTATDRAVCTSGCAKRVDGGGPTAPRARQIS